MKTSVIIFLHAIFLGLIIVAFLPSLNISDDGYKTKKAAVITVKNTDVDSMALDASDIEVTSASAVVVLEDSVEEEVAPIVATANDVTSDVKSTVKEAAENVASIASKTATGGLYSVVDGNKLDAHSYAGFKLYRNWCARCHGTYGQGMVGPNLADSLKLISKEEFYDTVENGKTGTIGSMPSWKANVQVMENRDQLYAYLMARSDGAIGVEKPKKQ